MCEVMQMKDFGDWTPSLGGTQCSNGLRRYTTACKAIDAVPGSNPQNVHYSVYQEVPSFWYLHHPVSNPLTHSSTFFIGLYWNKLFIISQIHIHISRHNEISWAATDRVFIKNCVISKILKYISNSGLSRFPLGVSVCTQWQANTSIVELTIF